MKFKSKTLMAAFAAFALGVGSVYGVPTKIGEIKKSDLGSGGLGDQTVEDWLEKLVKCDVTQGKDATWSGDEKAPSVDLGLGGYDYLVIHWGGNRNIQGGILQAFNIKDDTGKQTFNTYVSDGIKGGGISFARRYNCSPVPDSGSTMALMGLGLAATELVRRRVVRK